MSKNKTPQPEIRKAYVFNKYVIITPGRTQRPRDIKETTTISKTADCPFCAANLPNKKIIDSLAITGTKDKLRVVKNDFPAVNLNNPKAYGLQEVIIETLNHQQELADFSEKQIVALLKMYARRTLKAMKNKKIDYILCFKNQGSRAGASLSHAHSQVFATAIVPEDLREESILAQRHFVKHQRCAYCDILKKEIKSSRRIYQDKFVAAFAPYASQYHYEAWILTKRHVDNITELNQNELRSVAKILKTISLKLKKLNLSFNYFLHNVISDKNQHFYIKIEPRDSTWAGVELGSGLVINSVSPEVAARYYRQ